jgi:hypothetical protein
MIRRLAWIAAVVALVGAVMALSPAYTNPRND